MARRRRKRKKARKRPSNLSCENSQVQVLPSQPCLPFSFSQMTERSDTEPPPKKKLKQDKDKALHSSSSASTSPHSAPLSSTLPLSILPSSSADFDTEADTSFSISLDASDPAHCL